MSNVTSKYKTNVPRARGSNQTQMNFDDESLSLLVTEKKSAFQVQKEDRFRSPPADRIIPDNSFSSSKYIKTPQQFNIDETRSLRKSSMGASECSFYINPLGEKCNHQKHGVLTNLNKITVRKGFHSGVKKSRIS